MTEKTFFQFLAPTKIIFGGGSSGGAGEELKALGTSKALVVTDPGVMKAGLVKPLVDSLEKVGIGVSIFDGVKPNPSVSLPMEGASLYRRDRCNGILAVGGGSSIDVAKAIGVVATNGGTPKDYEGVGKFNRPIPPLVTVPTTYGTGSEVSPFSVLTVEEERYKFTVAGPLLFPRTALVDPALMMNLPPELSAAVGMDALSHAIESFLSKLSLPITEALCLHAMGLIARGLRNAVLGKAGPEEVAGLAIASTMTALCFSNTRCGNVHAMSMPLGGYYDAPHGVICAICLPPVMEFNLPAAEEKLAAVAGTMGANEKGLSVRERAREAIDSVRKLAADISIETRLSQVGCKEEHIPEMAAAAMKSGNIAANPRKTELKDIEALLRAAL